MQPGSPRVVVLSGEPGIGKTRLASEAATRAAHDGARVLYGRSEEGLGAPYQPFVELLSEYAADAGREVLTGLPAEVRELSRLVPALRSPGGQGADPAYGGGDRYVLFGAIRMVLAVTSAQVPLVLVLDDLHWADSATLLLLAHLLSAPESPRALFVLTYRPAELSEPDLMVSTLEDSRRRRRVLDVPLEGLEAGSIERLIEERAGGTRSADAPALARALARDAGGNPFYITEILRSEQSRVGREGERPAAGGLDVAAPQTVRDVIRRRTTRLGDESTRLLAAAALIGPECDLDLLAQVVARPSVEIAPLLDGARRAGLIAELPGPGARFGFVHALVEATLRDEVGPAERGHLHRRAAEAMAAIYGDGRAGKIAQHWYHAEPPDRDTAGAWAERAGRQALAQRDPGAATRWFGHALDLHGQVSGLQDDERRCELLIDLGRALLGDGNAAFRETLLEAARMAQRLGHDGLLVRAAIANNRGFVSSAGEVDEERLVMLDAALAAVGDHDSADRAALLATLGAELYFSPDHLERRIELSDEALAMARRVGDSPTLSAVLTARITIWGPPENLDERLRNTAENVRLADRLGDTSVQFRALRWQGASLLEAGRLEEAERTVEREAQIAESLGDPTALWLTAQDRAHLAVVHGRLEDAEQLAQEALKVGTASGQPDALMFFGNQIAAIRWEQGRLPELQQLIAETVAQKPNLRGARAVLALAYSEADLLAEAEQLLAMDAASEFEELLLDVVWLAAHVQYAHVAADVRHHGAASLLYERLRPWPGRVAWTGGVWGPVDLALGRLALTLGHFDEAQGHLAAARADAERWGAPIWRARAALEQGRVWLEQGDQSSALVALEEAAEDGRRWGAETVARRSKALLGRARAAEALAASPIGARFAMRAAGGIASGDGEEETAGTPVAVLRSEGELWRLSLGKRWLMLDDAKGVRHMARLLESPGVELHVLDLERGGAAQAREIRDPDLRSSSRPGDAGPLLDEAARRSYRERLEDLDEQLEEGKRFNDPERAAGAREEIEFIGRELAAATGLNGRPRRAGDPAERARVNVTRALHRVIGKAESADPLLGHHLRTAIRTGAFCVYQPPPTPAARRPASRMPS